MASKNVEDAYPLTPMQEGLLFHSLYAQDRGVYVTHITCTLDNLNVEAFEKSWQRVVDRHPALRTAFVWENLPKPLQVVGKRVKMALEQHDLRGLTPGEQGQHINHHLGAEQSRDFKLTKAPLVRLTLFRVGDDSYRFLYSHHHILLDGWSDYLLLREVFGFYEAFQQGRELHLAQPRSFRDYIGWLQRQSLEEAEAFWREKLRGFQVPNILSIDRAPGSLPSKDERSVEYRIPATTATALQSIARQHQLTLNTLMQGTLALLLNGYSGEDDIVFGATVSGRPAEMQGVETIMGVFINTLPVRIRLSPERRLISWLQDIQTQQLEMQQYAYSPLRQVQSWSEVPRGQRLFDVILDFENHTAGGPLGSGTTSLQIGDIHTDIKMDYPLFIKVSPGSDLLVTISYDTQRFDASTIERMLRHLHHLLDSIVADPDQSLAQLHLLTPAEHQFLVIDSNDTAHPFPHLLGIHHLFEQQVARSPSAIALTFEDHQLTYAQLDERANRLAHFLRRQGVGPDTLIAVFMHRSVEMVVALLGILKAGAAYVPLDPEYPRERLLFMLADAQTEVILTQQSLIEGLPEGSATVVALDAQWDEISACRGENPHVRVEPDHLAYVIYTSGSTGRPKGVMVPHRCVVNFLSSMSERPGLNSSDRLVAVTTLSFDIAALELYLPLVTGAQVRVASRIEATDARQLMHLLREASVMQATPATWRMLVEAGWEGAAHFKALCGGEALELELAQELVTRAGEVWNLYGPTETTIWSAATRIEAGAGRVSIGGPIRNTQLYVLDARMRSVPVGVTGELYIGGVGVCRGYYRRPGLTAERFVPDPFDGEGGRLYRTGDVARYREDGAVEYVGRVDAQVKVRGYRIELGEIESVVREQAGVRECVVVARGEGVEKRLVGYVVGEGISIGEIRRGLAERLPEYMVPQVIVELEEMPLTPNGKVDRRALPEVSGARPELAAGYEGARTAEEELLVGIWSEVLGVERVGIHDNFFALGGDSILSIRVVAKAAQLGLRLSPHLVFLHRTIAALAAVADSTPLVDAEQGILTGSLPLTPIQHWFFDQHLVDPHHWNQALLLALPLSLNPTRLRHALQAVLAHHDALRLRFSPDAEGNWRQFYAAPDADSVPYTHLELGEVEPGAEQRQAIEEACAAVQASLDLRHGPLIRVAQMELGSGQGARLLLVIHHLAVDVVSWRMVVEDLERAYEQLEGGGRVDLGAKSSSYRQWGRALEARAAEIAKIAEVRDYWEEGARQWRRAGALPVDYAGDVRERNTVESARYVEVELSEEETVTLLREVPGAYHTQINEVLLTALVEGMKRWTGEGRLRVEVEGHGRDAVSEGVEVTRTVGWFTSIVPMVLEVGVSGGVGERLKEVKEGVRERNGRGAEYGMLKYVSGSEEAREAVRMMCAEGEVSFNYVGQMDGEEGASRWYVPALESSGPLRSLKGRRKYLIEIEAQILRGKLKLVWSYSEHVHRRATVERVAGFYLDALRALIAHCRSPETGGHTPSDFPKVSLNQEELDGLIAELGSL